jgi:hypothetical protein
MKIEALKSLLVALGKDNPVWKPLNKANLDSYFEVLEPISDELFQSAVMVIRRTKFYGWPGAGEIYELCMGQKAKQQTVVSDGERIWYKTLAAISSNPTRIHDEWKVAQRAIDMTCGCIGDIRTADEQKLGFMKREFIKLVDSGMIQRGEL